MNRKLLPFLTVGFITLSQLSLRNATAQNRVDPRRAADAYAGPVHLETRRTRQITFTYNLHAETPDERIAKWVVNLPIPPNTGSQQVTGFEFTTPEYQGKWPQQKEKSALHREIASAIISPKDGAAGKLAVTATFKAVMSERRLVPGRLSAGVADLSTEEKKHYTMPTTTCNYRDAGVQSWIEKNQLLKQKNESDVQFGFRAFQAVQNFLTYEVPNKEADFFRCSRSVRTGNADCGASNLLFCAILRNSGVPARVYCGRWIINPKPGDSHSRGEFFAAGIGWVPVDATAQAKPGGDNRKNFGTDPALYFATSTETDWEIDLPEYGVQKLAWLHQYTVPYRNPGKAQWEGFQLRETFTLTER